MSRPWMPLYVADYLADTAHLGALESGAYLHLIFHYWTTRSLPKDDKSLARIAKMTSAEWKKSREIISAFFDENWVHKRIEKELAASISAYERRACAGKKGGEAKANREQCSSNATAPPQQSQPQPHSIHKCIEARAARSVPGKSVKAILEECLSDQTASDLVAHRKAKRAPMTPRAATLLVQAFVSFGDPEAAAQAMILRGWTGFKASWMREDARAGPAVDPRRDGVAMLLEECRKREAEDAGNQNQMLVGDVRHLPLIPTKCDAGEGNSAIVPGRSGAILRRHGE
jgi:uncharacterized protein YdaU (DUF1376 family)